MSPGDAQTIAPSINTSKRHYAKVTVHISEILSARHTPTVQEVPANELIVGIAFKRVIVARNALLHFPIGIIQGFSGLLEVVLSFYI